MTNTTRWTTILGISFLLTVGIGWLDYESKTIFDVFQAQNLPALVIYTVLFAVPVTLLVYFGEWVWSFFREPGAETSGT